MGGVSSSRQSSSSDPWKGQQPYLKDVFAKAKNYSEGNPQSRVAGQSKRGTQASNAAFGYGSSPGSYSGSIQDQATGSALERGPVQIENNPFMGVLGARSVSGPMNSYHEALKGFGDGSTNPYLDAMYESAAGNLTESLNKDILPGVHAAFGSGGRTGSAAHRDATGRAVGQATDSLGDLATNLYGGAYETDRNRALQAATAGGQIENTEWGQMLQAALGGSAAHDSRQQQRLQSEKDYTSGIAELAAARQAGAGQEHAEVLDKLGLMSSVGAQDRSITQQQLDAPFNQLQQYSSIVQQHPYISNRSSGSSKGMSLG